ncbi:unnamed protein product [Trichobilharzia szidati]|nr:unnamed protein product [Trichobilharzia szidati]
MTWLYWHLKYDIKVKTRTETEKMLFYGGTKIFRNTFTLGIAMSELFSLALFNEILVTDGLHIILNYVYRILSLLICGVLWNHLRTLGFRTFDEYVTKRFDSRVLTSFYRVNQVAGIIYYWRVQFNMVEGLDLFQIRSWLGYLYLTVCITTFTSIGGLHYILVLTSILWLIEISGHIVLLKCGKIDMRELNNVFSFAVDPCKLLFGPQYLLVFLSQLLTIQPGFIIFQSADTVKQSNLVIIIAMGLLTLDTMLCFFNSGNIRWYMQTRNISYVRSLEEIFMDSTDVTESPIISMTTNEIIKGNAMSTIASTTSVIGSLTTAAMVIMGQITSLANSPTTPSSISEIPALQTNVPSSPKAATTVTETTKEGNKAKGSMATSEQRVSLFKTVHTTSERKIFNSFLHYIVITGVHIANIITSIVLHAHSITELSIQNMLPNWLRIGLISNGREFHLVYTSFYIIFTYMIIVMNIYSTSYPDIVPIKYGYIYPVSLWMILTMPVVCFILLGVFIVDIWSIPAVLATLAALAISILYLLESDSSNSCFNAWFLTFMFFFCVLLTIIFSVVLKPPRYFVHGLVFKYHITLRRRVENLLSVSLGPTTSVFAARKSQVRRPSLKFVAKN